MEYYKRKLPHLQIQGGEYFITFILEGSLPLEAIENLKLQQEQLRIKIQKGIIKPSYKDKIAAKIFLKYEELIENNTTGPTWLSRAEIANTVAEAIHYRDRKEFDLYAFCIMSNHVHLVFRHLETFDPTKKNEPIATNIMRRLKRFTALKCNQLLDRSGAFWQEESYDRLIRNNLELERVIKYTLNNPVKANLIKKWEDWPYYYCKSEFAESFKSA